MALTNPGAAPITNATATAVECQRKVAPCTPRTGSAAGTHRSRSAAPRSPWRNARADPRPSRHSAAFGQRALARTRQAFDLDHLDSRLLTKGNRSLVAPFLTRPPTFAAASRENRRQTCRYVSDQALGPSDYRAHVLDGPGSPAQRRSANALSGAQSNRGRGLAGRSVSDLRNLGHG